MYSLAKKLLVALEVAVGDFFGLLRVTVGETLTLSVRAFLSPRWNSEYQYGGGAKRRQIVTAAH